ncbi:hypothetical protein [Hymenobacter terrenus]|uniref:hypothetical protein n=1 Tax=Hymenobacter terrenus TaxID=1629124 RepID=UPI0006198265|nr:hypothetical protein [Hymenobacter terrenus]
MLQITRSFLTGCSLITLVSVTGCKKESVSPEAAATTTTLLLGRWELTKSSGGIAGGTYPADSARKQEIIFTTNGQTQSLLNGVVTNTASYSLIKAPSYATGKTERFLFVNQGSNNISSQLIEQVSATDLVLADDYADGMARHYTKR